MQGKIIEIFSSIQGEGLWVGRPQVFVRFKGCRLHCSFCDTPLTHSKINECRVEFPPFSKQFEKRPLEFSVSQLNETIRRFEIPSLALTGGEPLEQIDFLEEWLPTIALPHPTFPYPPNYRRTGIGEELPLLCKEGSGEVDILLETSGIEVEALKRIINFISIVSLDIKIPSATKEPPLWERHDDFIQVALQRPAYAKVVFDEQMTKEEIERLRGLIQKYPALPFIFQPVSPLQKRDMPKIFSLFQKFSTLAPSQVRLIPQVHKFLQIL